MTSYFLRHLQVFFETLGRLSKSPLPTAMTVMVIGIALSLPLILYKVTTSLDQITKSWRGSPEISVFLNKADLAVKNQDVDEGAIEFGQALLANPAIDDVQYISPAEAIIEFRESSGVASILGGLDDNPLPPLLVVFPDSQISIEDIEILVQELQAHPLVDEANFDQLWIERLRSIVELFSSGVVILSILMSVGVLLIISDTVRINISNRKTEIEIINQVGGTNAFVRRPFLYHGAIQALLGAVTAVIVSSVTLYLLKGPVQKLAALYESQFEIGWYSFEVIASVLVLTVSLGILAAFFTVNQYLRDLKPSERGM